MKAYREVELSLHALLAVELVGGEWSTSRSGRFTPGERAPATHWIVERKHILQSLENHRFRKIFEPKKDEVRSLG
jgi:hypothetical protein